MSESTRGGSTVTAIILISIAFVAGAVISKRLWVHRSIHEPVQQRVTALTAALAARGITLSEMQLTDEAMGAEQVVVVTINQRPLRLVELDPAKHAKELEQIHAKHLTHLLGSEQPAEDEGSFVLVDFENHPEKEKILEAFHQPGGQAP